MGKTAKTEDVVGFSTFDAAAATDQIRTIAEKGLEQSSQVYATVKENTEAAQKALEESYENAKSASSDFTLKALAAMRANTMAGFDHFEALAGVTTLSGFIELQTSFIRSQSEAATDQAKELQAVATKVAEDVFKPLKEIYAKSVADLKSA